MQYLWRAIAVVLGYLLGSISFSVILTKNKFHSDVRTQGSGNAGATNVARVFGMKAGVATLLGDMAKTVAAMGLGLWLAGEAGLALAGASCLVGHCWPLFFAFRGGKGVSVGAAIALMIDWRLLVIVVAAFAIGVAISQIVSVGSVIAAITLPIAALLLGVGTPKLLLALFTGLIVLFMHRANINRLIHHQESKFKPKSKG